jgi:hypothetical protein
MSALDPLRTLRHEHNLARTGRPNILIAFPAPLLVVASASASVPPPAANTWSTIAWEGPGRERSLFEIEQRAGPSGYQIKVSRLVIAGRKIEPARVSGLLEMTPSRNYLRLVGGYCDAGDELIGIEDFATSAPKWRYFQIPYAPSR